MEVLIRVLDYLLCAIPLGMTFLYGSVGEIIVEKVGHLNLGIPGIMCVGGASGCAMLQVLYESGLPPFLIVILAILASFVGALLMGLIYSFLTVTLKANQNVTGLAMTTFGVGTMKFVMSKIESIKYLFALDYFRFPFAKSENSLKYCGVMVFFAIIIAFVVSFILNRTRVGLNLKAVGENPATADAAGINVTLYKYIATCVGCGIAGLGGLFYIMDYAGSQEAYLSIEALGWLSIALVIFALWKPILSILGSALFGALYVAGSYIPGIRELQIGMSTTPLLKMLPYVVTIIVLIIVSIKKNRDNQPPESLGVTYFREDR